MSVAFFMLLYHAKPTTATEPLKTAHTLVFN